MAGNDPAIYRVVLRTSNPLKGARVLYCGTNLTAARVAFHKSKAEESNRTLETIGETRETIFERLEQGGLSDDDPGVMTRQTESTP
jgi:hypothetical protein